MKTVYVCMSADVLHPGHLNIIKEARKLGGIVIGLLTDKAICGYKRPPLLSFNDRKAILENIKGVVEVIAQESLDQIPNIKKLKPDFVVHGDDWKTGFQKEIRQKVIYTLKGWGGTLVEPIYTQEFSTSKLRAKLTEIGITPEARKKRLRQLLEIKQPIRILEAHNGLTGLIVENIKIMKDNAVKEFDGIWISSLTDSTSKGKPDIEFVDLTSRINTIQQILEVTTKPVIVDCDTGGIIEHFPYTVKSLDRLGISAIIIEDKTGLKKNSLFGTDVEQSQETIEKFSNKISAGKQAQVTNDLMIIARIESLILKKGLNDALKRAKAYIEAGADAIMIHSKEKEPDEILEFCKKYSKFDITVPLVAVPSTYNNISDIELAYAGVNIVIYANHLLRSAYPAMVKVAESILYHERSFESDKYCMPIKEIINLIPVNN